MALLVIVSMTAGSIAAQDALQPTFIVLTPAADFNAETARLELDGAHIRQGIPPRIVIADLPVGAPMAAAIQSKYVSAVPLADLSSFGPVAVAAGVNWNRNFVNPAGAAAGTKMGAMSAMRALVAKESLAAPQGISATANPNGFRVIWQAVPAALYYHVEVSKDADFSRAFYETRTGRLSAEFPRPEGAGIASFYVRVRAADRPDPENAENDLFGRWSAATQISVTGASVDASRPAPELTSPVDALTSTGFTILLEWGGEPSRTYRVQVSRSSSFSTTLVDELVPFEAFAVPSAPMHVGDTLYWRVRESSERLSPWSSSRRFTIGEPHHAMNDVFVNPEAPR